MAINKNHEVEELNGIKCAVVERKIPLSRANFIKELLEFNHFKVVVREEPISDNAAPAENSDQEPAFTVGVTQLAFNTINALYGRLLRTPSGRIVTPAYWQQKEDEHEIPYYEYKA